MLIRTNWKKKKRKEKDDWKQLNNDKVFYGVKEPLSLIFKGMIKILWLFVSKGSFVFYRHIWKYLEMKCDWDLFQNNQVVGIAKMED